jgi:hypothetical protein
MGLLENDPAPAAEPKDSLDDKNKPTDNQDQTPDWLKAAKDENLHKNPTLRRYKSLDEALVGHVQLKSKLGENPVAMPGEKDPPEKWDEFFETHFKVPKDPAGYKESLKFPEKHPPDELDDNFLATAKKLRLAPNQVQGLYDWLGGVGSEMEAQKAEQAKKKNDENIAELTKRYGHDLKKNEQIAEVVLTKLFPAGAAAKLKAAGLATDPEIFSGLVKVGTEFLDGDIKGLKGGEPIGGKKSKAELEQMIRFTPRWFKRNLRKAFLEHRNKP